MSRHVRVSHLLVSSCKQCAKPIKRCLLMRTKTECIDRCEIEMGMEPNNEGSGSVKVQVISGLFSDVQQIVFCSE